jgi:hypothetical protein
MPKTNSVRILKLFWVAWTENDYGEHGHIRYGWSDWHARMRAIKKDVG